MVYSQADTSAISRLSAGQDEAAFDGGAQMNGKFKAGSNGSLVLPSSYLVTCAVKMFTKKWHRVRKKTPTEIKM